MRNDSYHAATSEALLHSEETYEPYGATGLELQLVPRDVETAWQRTPPPFDPAEILAKFGN